MSITSFTHQETRKAIQRMTNFRLSGLLLIATFGAVLSVLSVVFLSSAAKRL